MLTRKYVLIVAAACTAFWSHTVAYAQSAATTAVHSQINLNLTSTVHSLVSSFAAQNPIMIIEGGAPKQVTAATLLTPAERLAVYQVATAGIQSILLSPSGNAVGGTFSMGPNFANYISSLSVPKGVSALRDFGTAGALNLSGDLTNQGALYGFSSVATVQNALISASTITNLPGGIISTILPSNLSGLGSTGNALNLSLSASNITNAGTISSSGKLQLSAATSIVNALPAGVASQAPVLQGANGVILVANSITNSGTIAALLGNVNIQSPTGSSLLVENTGGTIQAPNGDISLTTPGATAGSTLTMNGGNYFSQNLNVDAACGDIKAYVGQITGLVNLTAQSAQFGAATSTLRLGQLNVGGDPTYFNTAGSLIIDTVTQVGSYTLPGIYTNGADLALLASGDVVVVNNNQIETSGNFGSTSPSDPPAPGGNLTVVAGANMTVSPATTSGAGDSSSVTTITGPSATGGAIDFSGARMITTLSKGNGGNMLFAAYSGNGNGSILTPGTINLNAMFGVASFSAGGFQPGSITIISGATQTPKGQSAVILPADGVDANTNGTVSIFQATPSGQLTIQNGSVIAGALTPGKLQPVNIGSASSPLNIGITNNLILGTSGNIYVTSGGILTLQQVQFGSVCQLSTSGPIYLSGSVVGSGNSSLAITSNYSQYEFAGGFPLGGILQAGSGTLSAANVALVATGPADINAVIGSAKSVSATAGGDVTLQCIALANGGTPVTINAGGSISVTSPSDLHVQSITTVVGPSGNTGNIYLNAGHDLFTGKLVASGGTSGNGGNITLIAGDNILTGDVIASGGTQLGNGGSITITAGNNVSTGNITSTGGAQGGNGGNIVVIAGGSISAADVGASAPSGVAGNITIGSGTGGSGDITLNNVYSSGQVASGTIILETPFSLTVNGTISAPGGSLTAGSSDAKIKTLDMGDGSVNIGPYVPIAARLMSDDEIVVDSDDDL